MIDHGKRARLKQLLGRMTEVPKDQKPAVGKRANETGVEIQAMFEEAKGRVSGSGNLAAGNATVSGEGTVTSSYETLKQERLDKLKAYQERGPAVGMGDGGGAKFPPPGSGRVLTSIEES